MRLSHLTYCSVSRAKRGQEGGDGGGDGDGVVLNDRDDMTLLRLAFPREGDEVVKWKRKIFTAVSLLHDEGPAAAAVAI